MASPSEAAVLQGPPAETAEEQVAKAQGEPVPAGEELQPGDRRQSGGERIPLHRPTLLESPVLMLTGQQVEPSPSTSLMSYPVPLFQAGRGGGAAAGSGGGGGGGGEPEGPAGSGAFAYPAWAYPRNFIAPSRNRQQQQQQQPPQPPEKPRRESMANDDGYNWRKYGEKQVKGSPYPRSYYKCSHPNCSAKKMIEREPKTGRISQAEFKNEHNHAKPGQVRGQRERAPVPLYGGGTARTYQEDSSGMAKQKQQQQSAMEQSSQDMQQEDAVAALAAMKYSPVMPGMLGAAPHDTPTSLLPIPASLRASTEPEDPQANGWAVPHRLHRSSSAAPAEPEESELSEEAYDSELLDSGVDDDEWQPGEDDYRTEPQSVSDAAAAAAAAVAAIGRRRMHQDTSGLIMLGKRRRGRQRAADSDEEDYDPELYGDDDEVKVLRNMSNGYKHQQRESVELEPPPPKRRSRPSPVVEGGLGAGRRASDVGLEGAGPSAAAAGGGDERSVVELETDADGMDDGFRWRKYGQKIVKGNPHPRSYYKCTHPGCNVRKQVERSGRNARMLVTTYEGTHTHDPPATTNGMRSGGRRGSVQARRPDSAAARPPLPDSSVGMTPAKVLLPSMEQLQQMASGSFPVLLAQPGGGLAFATGGDRKSVV